MEYVRLSKHLWTQAQGHLSGNYWNGICIYHLANLLIAVRGKDDFIQLWESVGRSVPPLLNMSEQVAIATEVAKRFHLLDDQTA
jgi:hypothetical protein